MKQNPERYCFRQDLEGDYYLIPVSMSEDFIRNNTHAHSIGRDAFLKKFSEFQVFDLFGYTFTEPLEQ